MNYMNKESPTPLVVIRCTVFNHEPFLIETLEGFVMQKTNFPFIAIVHDDASTDGSAAIIRKYEKKYPHIIKPIYQTDNQWSKRDGSLHRAMEKVIPEGVKYEAICEGDDCWTNPNKLQMQVDYLEQHPECVLCHTDYLVSTTGKHVKQKHYDDEPYFGPGHVHSYHICTLTVLYRREAYMKSPKHKLNHPEWKMGDDPLWIELSQFGKFYYIDVVTGKYRLLPNSASHSTDVKKQIAFWESYNEITEFYSKLYGYPYQEPTKHSLYLSIMRQCYDNGDKKTAKRYWIQAKEENAINLRSFLFYFCNVYNTRWIIKLLYKLRS